MNETDDLSWIVSLVVVFIPALLALIGTAITRDIRVPRPLRNIELMTGALQQTPQASASYGALDAMLSKYIESTGPALTASKKINRFNVGMVVFLLLVALPSIYGLIRWTFSVSGTGWQWVAWPVTVAIGLSLLLLIVAGMSTVYDISKPKKPSGAA